MNRRDAALALLALGTAPFSSLAQQAGKVWRIGFLEYTSMAHNASNLDAFLVRMKELGYAEGRHFIIDYRSADGRGERYADLAAELVRAQVDLIVARGTPAAMACNKATTTIPIIISSGAPLLFAKSLAKPGGNITGLATFYNDLTGKRIQILKEIIPDLARIAYLSNTDNSNSPAAREVLEKAARSLGIQSVFLDVRRQEDIRPAFDHAARKNVHGLVTSNDGILRAHRGLIIELAAKHRLPSIYGSREFVEDGGLVSYGANYRDGYRLFAELADKIFKGARPADMPMEQATKFDLAINLKVAKSLGLSIPQSLLLRADRAIQ